MANQGNQLDETFFRQPFDGGLHSNSILYYFAQSPFFDPASKNALIFSQGLSNYDMMHFLTTRELFEAKVKERPGLEFVVAEPPAESGPGMGTGVWVINKQMREQMRDEEDKVTVLATYFIVGEDIYMAPSFADVMSSRMAAISTGVAKILPTANVLQRWTPAEGRKNKVPAQSAAAKTRSLEAKEAAGTPLPDSTSTRGGAPSLKAGGSSSTSSASDYRVLEDALMIHQRYGHEYMNENPITGKPGQFQLSASGRKEKAPSTNKTTTNATGAPAAAGGGATAIPTTASSSAAMAAMPALNTKVAVEGAKNGKDTKSPKTPNMPKPKRRKSKMSGAPTPS